MSNVLEPEQSRWLIIKTHLQKGEQNQTWTLNYRVKYDQRRGKESS